MSLRPTIASLVTRTIAASIAALPAPAVPATSAPPAGVPVAPGVLARSARAPARPRVVTLFFAALFFAALSAISPGVRPARAQGPGVEMPPGQTAALSRTADLEPIPPLGSAARCSLWVDAYTGEPTTFEEMIEDLDEARVIYIGEAHTLARHHRIQQQVVEALAARGDTLAVGFEMLETDTQPEVDRYNRGEISFDTLAARIDWKKRWSNYEQYRGILEAARAHGAPVLALNARRDIVRKVGMEGWAKLAPEDRALVAREVDFDQPMYETQMTTLLQVHARAMGMANLLRTMFEAQVVRDETMAQAVADYLQSEAGRGRTAIVICGSGHCAHGLGIPSRVRRRMPGLSDRILLMSESGEVVLSETEKKLSSGISITHAQLKHLQAPIADYLQVSEEVRREEAVAPEEAEEAKGE